MSQALLTLSLWLHALATVILIGYYMLLSLVYLPYLSKEFRGAALGAALDAISERVRPWLSVSLLVFLVTGVYLTLGDAYYLGFGDFGNAWSVLMLVKHVIVLAMIALGVILTMTVKRGLAVPATAHNPHFEPWGRIQLIAHATSLCGALVLLLTAVAQAQ